MQFFFFNVRKISKRQILRMLLLTLSNEKLVVVLTCGEKEAHAHTNRGRSVDVLVPEHFV